jgi:hypothetical protein
MNETVALTHITSSNMKYHLFVTVFVSKRPNIFLVHVKVNLDFYFHVWVGQCADVSGLGEPVSR